MSTAEPPLNAASRSGGYACASNWCVLQIQKLSYLKQASYSWSARIHRHEDGKEPSRSEIRHARWGIQLIP
eukprot:5588600-Pleurochrysis_carterae.AAC.1